MMSLRLPLLPVSHMVRGLSVLLAAMPAGATTSMLASKSDRDPQFAVKLVGLSVRKGSAYVWVKRNYSLLLP